MQTSHDTRVSPGESPGKASGMVPARLMFWGHSATSAVPAPSTLPPSSLPETGTGIGQSRPHSSPPRWVVFLFSAVAICAVGLAILEITPFAQSRAAATTVNSTTIVALWVAVSGVAVPFLFMLLWMRRSGQREISLVQNQLAERQKAEEALELALNRQDALLKEVHHRVKNNLQLITSLLSLQADSIPEGPMRRVFDDCQNRIRTVALISERVYWSGNLTKIDMPEFVHRLADGLLRSHNSVDLVKLTVFVDVVSLDVDTAVPCGLILNELISNSLQHAFPNGAQGELSVSLSEADTSNLQLRVSDNGVGLPADVDLDSEKFLGLNLVKILAEQVDGTVTVSRKEGTTLTTVFPKPRTE
ncbi:MAG: sensor histidine kinase [SAR202 cluster bacterium]|nr:sensor histidine kinase [SAR202 cluster bacterium]